MIFLFVGGCSAWVHKATTWRVTKDGGIEALASRGRVIATFLRGQVLGVFYDNQYITTYGFAGTADFREIA